MKFLLLVLLALAFISFALLFAFMALHRRLRYLELKYRTLFQAVLMYRGEVNSLLSKKEASDDSDSKTL